MMAQGPSTQMSCELLLNFSLHILPLTASQKKSDILQTLADMVW